jgi:hypothetical protein
LFTIRHGVTWQKICLLSKSQVAVLHLEVIVR